MDKEHSETVPGIPELASQVAALQAKIDQLSRRLTTLEEGRPVTEKHVEGISVAPIAPHQETVITRVEQGALLPRIAVVCFLLVFALILRTITDNRIVNIQIGSLLGLTYAVVLIGSGWWLYERKSKVAPVFPSCGLLLLFSIVFETHSRFAFLPTSWAYTILLAAAFTAIWLSLHYRAAMLICLGTLGTAAVGMMINFPYPLFPYLGLLLLVGNWASYLANRRRMCPFLRYVVLLFTIIFWLLWSFKLNVSAACDEPTADLLSAAWFFPILFSFWLLYLAMVLLNTLRRDIALGFYEGVVPTICAVGAFWAGIAVAGSWCGKIAWFGIVVLSMAMMHFVLAWILAGRDKEGAGGSNAFTFAGVCLLVLGLGSGIRDIIWALPLWSAFAFALLFLSAKWRSGGVRVTSYLLQIVTCGYGVAAGVFAVDSPVPVIAALAALIIFILCLQHYRWSRRHKPDVVHSAYFSWLDKKDVSALAVLVAGLLSGYYFALLGLFLIFSRTLSDYGAALQSGQSVVINLGAVLLLLVALSRKNSELVVLAAGVAVIGAVRVFILDLFSIKGVPLVVSVFSFGMVAAVASVVMSRWQKKQPLAFPADDAVQHVVKRNQQGKEGEKNQG
jgi:hypothetical protein